MKKSLTKKERLRGMANLKKVFAVSGTEGRAAYKIRGLSRKTVCPGAKLCAVENGLDYNRVVVSPVRRIGGSVVRNRVRRVGKEAYRYIKSSIKPGFDLAFILFSAEKSGLSGPRRNISGDFSYGERISQFSFLLKKADLFCED
jgi:ribonuclease P protein component